MKTCPLTSSNVSPLPLPLPHGTDRGMEVLVVSLFYKNNLLNSFLIRFDRTILESLLCLCGEEEQTALHLLTSCSHLLSMGNGVQIDELDCFGLVSVLNCSRDPSFMRICKSTVENKSLNLRAQISPDTMIKMIQ